MEKEQQGERHCRKGIYPNSGSSPRAFTSYVKAYVYLFMSLAQTIIHQQQGHSKQRNGLGLKINIVQANLYKFIETFRIRVISIGAQSENIMARQLAMLVILCRKAYHRKDLGQI